MESKKSLDLVLIRHAQSEFNKHLHSFISAHPELSHARDIQEGQLVLKDVAFVDTIINKEGEQQAKQRAKGLDGFQFHSVYVSPLRRAVQTTILLFENHPDLSNITFFIAPYLAEIFNTTSSLTQFDIQQFIHQQNTKLKFDFRYLDKQPKNLWMADVLYFDDEEKQQQLLQKFNSTSSDEDVFNVFREKFINSPKLYLEEWSQLYQRTYLFKEWLKQKAMENGDFVNSDSQIGIVTHSGILTGLTGQYIDENNFIQGAKNFKNCEIYEYQLTL